MTISGLDLIVTRNRLSEARIAASEFPEPLPEGSCLLEIDRFALTANNITYGVAADMLGYWDFFPTGDETTGRIPVWGFAQVIASAHPEITTGTRVYGYLPMSTHLLVQPGQIGAAGFTDIAPHRAARAPIYNHYAFTHADPEWRPESEALISLFRPLFTTAFLLEDLHRENGYFGASNVILSSASSKTAIGLAFLLARSRPAGLSVTGLTSPGNRAFVEGLGIYDRVTSYDEVSDLAQVPSAFVDMAGNAALRRRIHEHLRDALTSSRAVGMTHWQESTGLSGDLAGPKPEFFFAPAYAQDRLTAWGRAGFQTRLAQAWEAFIAPARDWFSVTEADGPDAVMTRYQAMLSGRMTPSEGLILSLKGG